MSEKRDGRVQASDQAEGRWEKSCESLGTMPRPSDLLGQVIINKRFEAKFQYFNCILKC